MLPGNEPTAFKKAVFAELVDQRQDFSGTFLIGGNPFDEMELFFAFLHLLVVVVVVIVFVVAVVFVDVDVVAVVVFSLKCCAFLLPPLPRSGHFVAANISTKSNNR